MQMNLFARSSHVPPFLHGLEAHSFAAEKQRIVNPLKGFVYFVGGFLFTIFKPQRITVLILKMYQNNKDCKNSHILVLIDIQREHRSICDEII